MSKHDLIWLSTPKRHGFPGSFAWGWKTACKCGWEQPGVLLGTKRKGRKDYLAHKIA